MRILIDKMGVAIDKMERELYTEGERKILHELNCMRSKLVRLEDDVLHHYGVDWFRCEGCEQLFYDSDRSSVKECAEYCCICVPEFED